MSTVELTSPLHYDGNYNNLFEDNKNYIKNIIKEETLQLVKEKGYKLKSSKEEEIIFTTGFWTSNAEIIIKYNESVLYLYGEDYTLISPTLGPLARRFIVELTNRVQDKIFKYIDDIIISNQNIKKEILQKTTFAEIDKTAFNIILENQSKIEDSILKNFIKIEKFYSDKVKFYNTIRKNIEEIDFDLLPKSDINILTQILITYPNAIELFNFLYKETINSYLNNKQVKFYVLYNQFEELGIFMSKSEKLIIKNLEDINNNISQMVGNMNSLIYNVYSLAQNINENLGIIKNNLRYSNILQTINAYMLNKK